jgi:hypothetical protein
LTSAKIIKTILYADGQVIRTKSDDKLKVAVNEIIQKYDMKISPSKTKAF